jgi:hypothetical protein
MLRLPVFTACLRPRVTWDEPCFFRGKSQETTAVRGVMALAAKVHKKRRKKPLKATNFTATP